MSELCDTRSYANWWLWSQSTHTILQVATATSGLTGCYQFLRSGTVAVNKLISWGTCSPVSTPRQSLKAHRKLTFSLQLVIITVKHFLCYPYIYLHYINKIGYLIWLNCWTTNNHQYSAVNADISSKLRVQQQVEAYICDTQWIISENNWWKKQGKAWALLQDTTKGEPYWFIMYRRI